MLQREGTCKAFPALTAGTRAIVLVGVIVWMALLSGPEVRWRRGDEGRKKGRREERGAVKEAR